VTAIVGQALAYATRGWPVFPCCPDQGGCPDAPGKCRTCKAPVGQAVPDGCLDATTDPGRIREWWRRWPSANVAIATGAPGPDVLDVDKKPAGTGYPALRKLTAAGLVAGAAMLTRTPSGGSHIYYAGTAQHCGSLPRHFIDFKAWHGYVLAPPSTIHGGRAYRLLDSRNSTTALDWADVKRILNPPRARQPVTGTWDGGELPSAVQRALAANVTDRSAALHRLVGACVWSGMPEDTIRQLAAAYQPALEKYGDRLAAEVERCMRKIGAQ
jgi:hypothetical protein